MLLKKIDSSPVAEFRGLQISIWIVQILLDQFPLFSHEILAQNNKNFGISAWGPIDKLIEKRQTLLYGSPFMRDFEIILKN